MEAALSGRLRHRARGRRDLPAVGDWVALEPGAGRGLIQAVLPRTSVFARRAAHTVAEEQIVAANVDIVFLLSAMDHDFNPRRIERYLTLAWESGAMPVVVLSKADSQSDPAPMIAEAERIAIGVPVLVTSARTGLGIEDLRARLAGHKTGALLGSSGVGKSTLINALVGYDRQETAAVRESDQRGRHTTTWRELVKLPGGGLLIDTPGMRALHLLEAEEGILASFADIEQLAGECDFRDCTHGPEPGCAVKRAVDSGTLPAERLANYHKLVAELAFLESKTDRKAQMEKKAAGRTGARALRKRLKDKER